MNTRTDDTTAALLLLWSLIVFTGALAYWWGGTLVSHSFEDVTWWCCLAWVWAAHVHAAYCSRG